MADRDGRGVPEPLRVFVDVPVKISRPGVLRAVGRDEQQQQRAIDDDDGLRRDGGHCVVRERASVVAFVLSLAVRREDAASCA